MVFNSVVAKQIVANCYHVICFVKKIYLHIKNMDDTFKRTTTKQLHYLWWTSTVLQTSNILLTIVSIKLSRMAHCTPVHQNTTNRYSFTPLMACSDWPRPTPTLLQISLALLVGRFESAESSRLEGRQLSSVLALWSQWSGIQSVQEALSLKRRGIIEYALAWCDSFIIQPGKMRIINRFRCTLN